MARHVGTAAPRYVVSLNKTDLHFKQIVEVIAPQGKFALIDDPEPIDIRLLKRKSVSLHWELMFTRSLFATPDMIEQHRLLEKVSRLVDEGVLRTTFNEHFGSERLQMIIKYNHQKSAKEILHEVYGALESFRSSAERKDDETMVVVKAL